MSKALDELKKQLAECRHQISELYHKANELNDKIMMQQLDDWLEENHITIKTFPMNHEMYDYVVHHGFPGGYIEYELEKWKPGTPLFMRGKYEIGEYSVEVGPEHNHSGLYPPDMVLRAIKEWERQNA